MLTLTVYDNLGVREIVETNDPFTAKGELRAPFARLLLDAAMQDFTVVISPGDHYEMPSINFPTEKEV